jgi:hypothetical protein
MRFFQETLGSAVSFAERDAEVLQLPIMACGTATWSGHDCASTPWLRAGGTAPESCKTAALRYLPQLAHLVFESVLRGRLTPRFGAD